jgi:hypothetical protein
VERDKPIKSESELCRSCHGNKKGGIFVFWRPFWIQNARHSKPAMNINSRHHNLLGNQISPQSEDFFILAAILDSKISREASDAGEFHLKTKSRDFRVIFDEK